MRRHLAGQDRLECTASGVTVSRWRRGAVRSARMRAVAAAVEATPGDQRKAAIAKDLVLHTVFGVSGQTLAESHHVAMRSQPPLSAEAIDNRIDYLAAHPLAAVDDAVVRLGIGFSRRYRIAYSDAALLAAAQILGTPVFYSEDLSHGQRYGDVEVLNPFL